MVDEYDIENPDRPRGMFSTADREFLLGESDIGEKSQAERNRRARIRERFYHTLLDFGLVSAIERRDRRRIFSEQERRENESERASALNHALFELFAFLYDVLESDADPGLEFEDCLRTGILRYHYRSETRHMVSPGAVTFEVDEPETLDIDSVARRLRRDGFDALSEGELHTMLTVLSDYDEMSPEALSAKLQVLKEQDDFEPPSVG